MLAQRRPWVVLASVMVCLANRQADQGALSMTVGQDRSVARARPIEHEICAPIVAIVTPFTETHIDIDALRRYLDWLWEHGAKTILVNGTTGEFFTTTANE